MFGIGIQELLIVLIIILVLFGGKKIPELSRSIGDAIRELRHGITGDENKASEQKNQKQKSA